MSVVVKEFSATLAVAVVLLNLGPLFSIVVPVLASDQSLSPSSFFAITRTWYVVPVSKPVSVVDLLAPTCICDTHVGFATFFAYWTS